MVPAQESSIFSRKLINLFAGMAFGSPGLPRLFADLGYRCHAIEKIFPVTANQFAHPEMILISDAQSHTLLLEGKCGANLKNDQLERYALVSSNALTIGAHVPPPASDSHNLLLIGQESFHPRLLIGSYQSPDARRVLAVVTAEGIKRIENAFCVEPLNLGFNVTLAIDWDVIPHHFMPVDAESQKWEFASAVIPEVIAAILGGAKQIEIDDLARSFILHWDLIEANYRGRLRDGIRQVLKIAATDKFSAFLSFSKLSQPRGQVWLFKIPSNLAGKPTKLVARLHACNQQLMDELMSAQMPIEFP
jgi:hypothetical protein